MICRISIIMLVLLAGSAFAGEQVEWTGKGADDSWATGANWEGGKVPGPHDIIILNPPPGRGPVIDIDIQCGEMRGPVWKSGDDQVVDVVGCNVVIEGWWRWANRGGGVGTINIKRANVDVQGMYRQCDSGRTYGITNITDSILKCKGLLIGDGGNGEVNIKGNTLFEVEENLNMGGSPGDNGRTYEDKPLAINMYGGILRIGRTLQCPSDEDRAGTASIELKAGTIICKNFTHAEVAYKMNIEEGLFAIEGDVTEDIKKDIEAGYITAFGGKDNVVCKYRKKSNRTVVTADNRKQARRAKPGNRSEDVTPDVKLTWSTGRKSKSTYNLYIGTSLDAVGADAKSVAKGLAKAEFDPDIDFSKTYHWRVDAIDEAGKVHKGTTWQFTTTDGKASDPSPAAKAEKVASNVSLAWKGGLAASSHKVYFGTDPEKLVDKGVVSGNSFTPKGLELGKQYYWRVDAINGSWKQSPWKGNLWSFTVDSGKATDPKPIDLAQWKPTKMTLSWSAARTATAHTVYISEKLEDVKKGTKAVSKAQKGTTYAIGDLKEATTYYWRVDQVTGDAVVKGDIWKFSTVGMLELKLDLAVPEWYDRMKPRPGTVKPGWYALCSPSWADMYMHD
ncbi:MAG: fibronectin type III domain-containing protein, partial [Planctomycetota bacterium]